MFLELGEYILISISFFFNISQNYANLALSETTLLCLCFTCCSLLAYTSHEFSNLYLYRHGDSGIMYSLLLPIIHMSLNFKTPHDNNETFNFFHIGCILFSFLPAIFELLRYKITADNLSGISYLASLTYILIFAYWFVLLLHKLDLLSFIFVCFLLCINIYLLLSIPTWLPGSFTFGELVVLVQSFTYFLFQLLATFLSIRIQSGIRAGNQYVTDYDMTIFIYVLISSVALFVALLWHVKWFRGHWFKCYFLLLLVLLLFTLPLLHHWMRQNTAVWLMEFVLQSKYSLLLISFWTLSCCVAVAVVIHFNREVVDGADEYNFNNVNNNNSFARYNNNNNRNNDNNINNNKDIEVKRLRMSRVRKLFHVLMVAVFVPSYFLNDKLLCLATVVALVLFLLLEAIRLLDIPPLGQPMRKHLKVFLDQQDSGLVIVTPIYLLIGCSAPLWISIGRGLSPLLGLAGVVSIGVGDTVASLVGTKVGRMHWKDSRKTIEGTVASIIAQLIITSVIILFDPTNHVTSIRVVATILMTSLLEAFTPQIDNLILPLFMFFALV